MYRAAEVAYSAMDFTGLGFISEKAFLDNACVKNRVPFKEEDIILFFKEYNLFP